MNEARPWQKARSVNSDTTAFPSKIPTITEPKGDTGTAAGACVLELAQDGGGKVPCRALIVPYGLGNDNDVFDLRVIGWRRLGQRDIPAKVIWVPTILGIFTCTVSAAVGVAGSPVLGTERFADTITLKTDNNVSQPTVKGADTAGVTSVGDIRIFSPTGDLIAWIDIPLYGVEKLELTFDSTTGTPSMNALVSFL